MSLILVITDNYIKENSSFWSEFTDSKLFNRIPQQNEQMLLMNNGKYETFIVDNIVWKFESKKGLLTKTDIIYCIVAVRKVIGV